ncbi:MAG: hypothetical protein ACK5LY_04310 [Lachnospirales bacterium]
MASLQNIEKSIFISDFSIFCNEAILQGCHLFQRIWDKYIDVRMFQVMTDINDVVDNYFYQSFNMKKLEVSQMVSYFR